jgi:hypothetical protein
MNSAGGAEGFYNMRASTITTRCTQVIGVPMILVVLYYAFLEGHWYLERALEHSSERQSYELPSHGGAAALNDR